MDNTHQGFYHSPEAIEEAWMRRRRPPYVIKFGVQCYGKRDFFSHGDTLRHPSHSIASRVRLKSKTPSTNRTL
jgi:hypothetical protein